ncbi:MAG: hypothetical protein MR794_00310 [Bacteroidales bacterium]|nr:hypothetical protein [Bacteroidales bacterium]
MMTFFHGSPSLFGNFELNNAGDGTGIKFGFGVYLTESEASAVHYSQPRKCALTPEHYLYTVEIPDLTEGNHLVSALPVPASIICAVEQKLGQPVPAKFLQQGKEFRKWLGCTLTGAKKAAFAEEKAAAEFLDAIGVIANVWPQAQTKPDGLRNCAIFNPANVRIVKRERIEIEDVKGKYMLIPGTRQEV